MARCYRPGDVFEDDHLRAIQEAHDHPDWVITREKDDLARLDFIRIGYVKGDLSIAVVCDKGHVFEMPNNQWEKERFAHNGKNEYGQRVR